MTDDSNGTTLCVRHARQVVGQLEDPSGDCSPRRWFNGNGDEMLCDVIANPIRTHTYLAHHRALRSYAQRGSDDA